MDLWALTRRDCSGWRPTALISFGALLRLAAICRICSSGSTDRRAFQRKQRASPAPEALRRPRRPIRRAGWQLEQASQASLCVRLRTRPAIRRRRTGESVVESSGASGDLSLRPSRARVGGKAPSPRRRLRHSRRRRLRMPSDAFRVSRSSGRRGRDQRPISPLQRVR